MRHLDQVVEEVRERGRQLTARLGNDPGKVMKMLMERAKASKDKQVRDIRVVSETQRG